MKKVSPFTTGILLFTAFIFNGCLSTKSPKIQHVIKENNKINCEIVVSPEAGAVADFSGKELKKFLKQSLVAASVITIGWIL